jgi:hypothetical protein
MPENRLPAAPLRNSAMTALLGFDVWSMDGIDLPPGAEVALTFESVHAEPDRGRSTFGSIRPRDPSVFGAKSPLAAEQSSTTSSRAKPGRCRKATPQAC